MNYVFICYPVEEYLTRDDDFKCPTGMGLDAIVHFYANALQVPEKKVWERFKLYNTLLDEYRTQGYTIAWGLFDHEWRPGSPDTRSISWLFNIQKDDLFVPVGVTKKELDKSQYPDPTKVIQSLPNATHIVCGGFHSGDCVRRYNEAAKTIGIRSTVDSLLTEQFFHTALVSLQSDSAQQSMNTGHLDPEMHEDNPQEELERLFHGKLNGKISLLVPQKVLPKIYR